MTRSMNPRYWLPVLFELHWAVVYLLIIGAWVGLFLLSTAQFHHNFPLTDWTSVVTALIYPHNHQIGFVFLFGMWGMMSLAMMLPSFIPTLKVYEDLRTTGSGSLAGFWLLIGGYVAVWITYAVIMTFLQMVLISTNILSSSSAESTVYPIVLLFFVAGVYQLLSIKDRCLTYCRNPLLIFLARGEVGLLREFFTGTRFAVWCLGCCFFLMALCLITGLMNIAWMGLMTLIITLEKLPDLGKYISKPLGIVLIASSLIIYLFSLSN